MTKTITTAVIAAALSFGTVAVASAQGFDPNPANRYPAYMAPVAQQPAYFASVPAAQSTQSAPVALHRSNKQLHSAPVRLQSQSDIVAPTTGRSDNIQGGGGF